MENLLKNKQHTQHNYKILSLNLKPTSHIPYLYKINTRYMISCANNQSNALYLPQLSQSKPFKLLYVGNSHVYYVVIFKFLSCPFHMKSLNNLNLELCRNRWVFRHISLAFWGWTIIRTGVSPRMILVSYKALDR